MLLSKIAVLAFLGSAQAHTVLRYFWVNGADTNTCIRFPPNNSPVTNVQSQDIACNVNGANPVSSVCSVAAGSQVTFEWHWEGRNTEGIADSHKGPIVTYMAKTNSASAERSPSSLNWFKISEAGLSGGKWAVDTLNANGGKWTINLPRTIQPGDYLLRAEVLALHSAYTNGGAQFYIGCVQVRITGGGNLQPPTVKLPGAYSATDKGILVGIYDGSGRPYPASYSIPGPAVISDNGGSVATTTRGGTAATTTRVSTGGGSGSPLYGQCGGTGWTGPTTCASGTCKKSNDYYSQCVP